MQPTDDAPETDLCAFRAELIGLLDQEPPRGDRGTARHLADRLGRLEQEATRREAPAATLAAIRGARALLALSELPPSPSSPPSHCPVT